MASPEAVVELRGARDRREITAQEKQRGCPCEKQAAVVEHQDGECDARETERLVQRRVPFKVHSCEQDESQYKLSEDEWLR